MKKHIQAQDGMDELNARIEALKQKKAALKKREIELKCKIDAIEKRNKEMIRIDGKLKRAEIDSIQHQGKEVGDFLASLKEPASSPKQTK